MTDGIENLIVEHLRHVRARVDFHAEELRDVKSRLSSLENPVAQVHKGMGFIHEDLAGVNARFDRLAQRVERIEQRLELRENA